MHRTQASPCQGRWQKSLIFAGGVVEISRFLSLSRAIRAPAPSSEGALVRRKLPDKLKFEKEEFHEVTNHIAGKNISI